MAAYGELAAALEAILTAEFGGDGFIVRHDRLHESVGHERAMIGISIESQSPMDEDYYVMETELLVQFYGRYRLDVDNEQQVDPRLIATQAERFMAAIRNYNLNSTGSLWYFNVAGIEYPMDATGNKSRFEARILARSNNPVIIETGI